MAFLLPLPPLKTDNLQFQKMFVIGLPSRSDRRDSMALAAAYTGLEFEYVDGVTDVESKTHCHQEAWRGDPMQVAFVPGVHI